MAKEYLIGDFLKRIKRPVKLVDDQDYKLVTIKMNHNGVVLRELKKGVLIKSKMYEVKKGDFILSGIDARNGAFGIVPSELDGAIVTNDFWYFEIDESIISKRLFLELTATTWFDEICKRGSDGTTQRIRLQKDKFFNQSVLLPEGNEQEERLEKILSFKKGQSNLDSEIINQKELATQLKQSILQEAIQGKLSEEWRKQNPDVEPASELLKRIKAEKAQLFKDKKIRKEKPLSPITEDDIPFDLPEGWVWAYVSDICDVYTGNSINKAEKEAKYTIEQPGLNYIGTKDVEFNMAGINYETGVIIPDQETYVNFRVAPEQSVLVCIEGGSSGKKIGITERKICFGNKLLASVPFLDFIGKYLYLYYNAPAFAAEFQSQSKGLRGGVSTNSFKIIKVPIPPEKELFEIVLSVEELFKKCIELESEITQSERYAQTLMQAVLQEAFESKKEEAHA